MNLFWLFRSNIKHLEYYHKYTTLEEFEKKCHDFYLLLPLWLLRNGYLDGVVIWRLTKQPRESIDFLVEGKSYRQIWVQKFSQVCLWQYPGHYHTLLFLHYFVFAER